MKSYEMIYLQPILSEEDYQATVDKYESLIKSFRGQVSKVDRLGPKRLAYSIGEHTHGYYVLFNFKSNTACVNELDRLIKLDEHVMRYLILRRD